MKLRYQVLLLSMILLLTACGSDDDTSTGEGIPEDQSSTPVPTATIPATAAGSPIPPSSPETSVEAVEFTSADEIPNSIQYWFPEQCEPTNPEAVEFTDFETTLHDMQCVKTQLGWPTERVPEPMVFDNLVLDLTETRVGDFERAWPHMMVSGVANCQWIITWVEAYQESDSETLAAATFWIDENARGYPTTYSDFPTWWRDESGGYDLSVARAAQAGDLRTVAQAASMCQDVQDMNERAVRTDHLRKGIEA